MIRLIDVVNFNSDASALSSKNWLRILSGGKEAELYKYLQLYIEHKRPVTFGWVGNTAIEMHKINPHCTELINDHPDIFEMVVRPLSHDLALLWDKPVFKSNVGIGKIVTEHIFKNVNPFFLPPEFALKNSQIKLLVDEGFEGVFIHLDRMKTDHKKTVPKAPYYLRGLFDVKTKTIPFHSSLTHSYLADIQHYDYENLDRDFSGLPHGIHFMWRDGESPFLIPETLEREEHFLKYKNPNVEFISLKKALSQIEFRDPSENEYKHYPANSLLPWFGDFRFYWFITDLKKLEINFESLSPIKKVLFLSLINSDILSSIEKDMVDISLVMRKTKDQKNYKIYRKSKDINGAEFLEIMELEDDKILSFIEHSPEPHYKKLWFRYSFLNENGFI